MVGLTGFEPATPWRDQAPFVKPLKPENLRIPREIEGWRYILHHIVTDLLGSLADSLWRVYGDFLVPHIRARLSWREVAGLW